MIAATILTFTSFTLMNNLGEADARTLYKDPDCSNIRSYDSDNRCNINVYFGGDCASSTYASSAKCNVNVDINRGTYTSTGQVPFIPKGNNELKLNFFIDSAIYCSGTTGWSKSACLANAVNNYNSNPNIPAININTDGKHDLLDVEATYTSKQLIDGTSGNNYYSLGNDKQQQVNIFTRGDSEIDMEGDGADGLFLNDNQLIRNVDNAKANNQDRQQFDLSATDNGDIYMKHNEYGFAASQSISNVQGPETSTNPSVLTTLNQAKQTLDADATRSGDILEYDTEGLSTVTQTINNINGKGTVTNFAGNPATANTETSLDGMRVNLEADGYGANVAVDNLLQTASQSITGFNGATPTGDTDIPNAENRINQMYFSAVARDESNRGYDAAEIDFGSSATHDQKIVQTISNSGGNVNLQNIASAELQAGYDQLDIAVQGSVDVDNVDQTIEQTIQNVNNPITSTNTNAGNNLLSINQGTTSLLLLAQDGPSQFFMDGFNQYLKQTVDGCEFCGNIGQVSAVFQVEDASTFELEDGSFQGLTQLVNQDGKFTQNQVTAAINVGGGTDAEIKYQQEIFNVNGQTGYTPYGYSDGNGISDFSANLYTGNSENLHCSVTSNGYYSAGSSYGSNPAPTTRTNAC